MAAAVVVQLGGVALTIVVGATAPSSSTTPTTPPAVEKCEAVTTGAECVMLKGHGPWHVMPAGAGAVSWHTVRTH